MCEIRHVYKVRTYLAPVSVYYYQSIWADHKFDVVFFSQNDCSCLMSLSKCYYSVVTDLIQKPPGRIMGNTEYYNSSWCFSEILFLAGVVVFQLKRVVFIFKNIGFSTFLDFEC